MMLTFVDGDDIIILARKPEACRRKVLDKTEQQEDKCEKDWNCFEVKDKASQSGPFKRREKARDNFG